MQSRKEWLRSLKEGDEICYEQNIKFSNDREKVIAKIVEVNISPIILFRLDNGVTVTVDGDACILKSFGVDKEPIYPLG